MNLAEMVEMTVTYLNDPRQTRFRRPDVVRHINRGQEEVKRKAELMDETLFSAVQDYSVVLAEDSLEFPLPSDFSRLIAVERVGTTTPTQAVRVEFSSRHGNTSTQALPDGVKTQPEYYLRGNLIGVVRPRDGYTLRMVYSKSLPTLADDSDISEIPADYHDLVCLFAAKRAYGSISRDYPEDLETLRMEGIHDMMIQLEERDRVGPTYVNVLE